MAGPGRRHANLLVCNIAPCPQWAAIIRANLAKIGIAVTPQDVSFNELAGAGGGDPVAVQLEEVVRGGDEPPFGPAGRSAAALEAADLAVELDLPEDGLDC